VLRLLHASGVAKHYCKGSTVIYSSLYFAQKLGAIKMNF